MARGDAREGMAGGVRGEAFSSSRRSRGGSATRGGDGSSAPNSSVVVVVSVEEGLGDMVGARGRVQEGARSFWSADVELEDDDGAGFNAAMAKGVSTRVEARA